MPTNRRIDDDDDDDRPRKRRRDEGDGADDDDRPRKRRRDEDDGADDEDRPRKRRKTTGSPQAGSTLMKFGIGALVVAIGLGVVTWSEGTIAFQSSAHPEEFTLKSLIARGPDGNPNVRVGKFVLCPDLVYQFNKNAPGTWTHVWIPAVPIEEVQFGAKGPETPKNVKALFFSTSIRNEGELKSRLEREKVDGLVNTRTSLSSETRNLLQQKYPGTNLDQCLIIQEGRTPFSRDVVYLMGAGAVLALLASGLFFGLGLMRKRQAAVSPD